MVFQISAKKRLLGSLVMFIDLVALTIYLSHYYDWISPVMDANGRDVQIARFRAWG
jgi:hypothetical protein